MASIGPCNNEKEGKALIGPAMMEDGDRALIYTVHQDWTDCLTITGWRRGCEPWL
jgi:hypothetical protein